jgi:hypothetical protein
MLFLLPINAMATSTACSTIAAATSLAALRQETDGRPTTDATADGRPTADATAILLPMLPPLY